MDNNDTSDGTFAPNSVKSNASYMILVLPRGMEGIEIVGDKDKSKR